MNNRRKLIVALGAAALAAPFVSFAQQQPKKVYRIGWLGAADASGYASRVEALRAGLHELGYAEGKNFLVEFRWADNRYELLPQLAAELVRQNVDVIVTHGTPGVRAAKQATTTIPIVMGAVGDAIAFGLVTSLARPEGNVTGSTFFAPELAAKRLELLKEIFPRVKRVAVLLNPDNSPANVNAPLLRAMQVTAKSVGVELLQFESRKPNELEGAFLTMKKHVDAVVIPEDSMIAANLAAIAERAALHRLPSIGFGEFSESGGLISYGPDFIEMYRRAAYFVDKIFKGAKPSDLPVEQPTKFEVVVNMKTAKALGIKFPNSILVRATKVIE